MHSTRKRIILEQLDSVVLAGFAGVGLVDVVQMLAPHLHIPALIIWACAVVLGLGGFYFMHRGFQGDNI